MSTAEHSPEQQPPYADMEAYVESMVDQFGYGSENHGSVPDAEADMAESVLDTLQPVGEPDEEGYYEKFVDPVSGKEVNGFTVNELRGMLDDRKERLEQEAAAQNQEREADVIALHRRNGDFRPESTGGHVNARRLRSALRSAELRDADRARKVAERNEPQATGTEAAGDEAETMTQGNTASYSVESSRLTGAEAAERRQRSVESMRQKMRTAVSRSKANRTASESSPGTDDSVAENSDSNGEEPTETVEAGKINGAQVSEENHTERSEEDEQKAKDVFARLYGAPTFDELPKHFQKAYSWKDEIKEKIAQTHVDVSVEGKTDEGSVMSANENRQGMNADAEQGGAPTTSELEARNKRFREKSLAAREAKADKESSIVDADEKASEATEAPKSPDYKGSLEEASVQTIEPTGDGGQSATTPERGANRLPKQPKVPKADRRIKGGAAEVPTDVSLELTDEEKNAPDIPGYTRHASIVDARMRRQREARLLLQERLEAGDYTDEERKITPDPGMTLEATILARKHAEDRQELLTLRERLDGIEAAGGLDAAPGNPKVIEEFSTAFGIGDNTPEQITAFGTGAKPESSADDDIDTEIVGLDELLDEDDSDESAPTALTDEELAEIEVMEKEFEKAYEARERERRLAVAPLSGPMPTMAYAPTPVAAPENQPITNEQARQDPVTVTLASEGTNADPALQNESANVAQSEPIKPFSLTFTMPNLEDGNDKVTRVVTNPINPGLKPKTVETTAETEAIEEESEESAEELSRLARIKRIGSVGLIRVREAVFGKLSSYNEVGDRTGFDKRRVAAAAAGVIAAGAAVYLAQKGISGLGTIGREAANGATPTPSGGAHAAPGYNPYTGGSIGPMGGQETIDSVNPNVPVATPPAEVVTPTGGHQTNINSSSFWDQIQKEYHTNNQDTADVLRRSRELNPGIDLDHVKPNQSVIMADLTPPASNLPKPSAEQLNNFQTLSSGNGTNTASEAVLNALRDHGIQNLTPKQFNYAVEQALQYDAGIHRALGERVYDANHMPNGYHFYIPAFDDAMMRHIIDLEDAKSTVN